MDLITQAGFNKKCSIHSDQIITINLDDNRQVGESPFCCLKCITQNKIQRENMLILDSILNSDDNTIIDELLLVEDDQIAQKIKQSLVQTERIARKEFESFFDEIKKEFQEQFCYMQKLAHSNIDHVFFTSQDLKEAHCKTSNKKELQNMLQEINALQGCNIDEKSLSKINNFITKMNQKKKENTKLIQENLNRYLMSQEILKLEIPNQIKQDIMNQMKQIMTHLEQVFKIKQIEIQNQRYENQQQNSMTNEEKLNIKELIFDLISNKSNYCSNQFLQLFQEKIDILNLTNLTKSEVFQEQRQPLNFNKFDQKQLNYVEDITSQLNQMNEYIQSLKTHQNNNQQTDQTLFYELNSQFNKTLNELKLYQHALLQQYQEKYVDKANTCNFILRYNKENNHQISVKRNQKDELLISSLQDNYLISGFIYEIFTINKSYTLQLKFNPFNEDTGIFHFVKQKMNNLSKNINKYHRNENLDSQYTIKLYLSQNIQANHNCEECKKNIEQYKWNIQFFNNQDKQGLYLNEELIYYSYSSQKIKDFIRNIKIQINLKHNQFFIQSGDYCKLFSGKTINRCQSDEKDKFQFNIETKNMKEAIISQFYECGLV